MIKRNLLVMGLAVLLSACGFQLRGTGTTELTIKELDLSARNAYGETVTQLRQVLEQRRQGLHRRTVQAVAGQRAGKPAHPQLRRRRPYRIRAEHRAELRHPARTTCLLSDKLEVQKVMHDGNNLVGSDQEATGPRNAPRPGSAHDAAPATADPGPARAAATADDKAKAEAAALKAAKKLKQTPRQSPLELPAVRRGAQAPRSPCL
jgi:LPS-assembly lipoprotein